MVLASCGGGSSEQVAPAPPPSSADYVVHEVLPSTIDPAANDQISDVHVIIPPIAGVTPVGKLFVFLPGTDGVPTDYQLILKAGAGRGFHTIGLDYANSSAVGVTCLTSTDVNCFWDVRREVITGGNYSPDVAIAPADSIVTRLTKAIAYLNTTYPSEGWGQYLANGAVDWSKIVVGGHSQGGGHAGVMTKLYAMSRACYFASPPDWDTNTNSPAAWESYTSVTPVSAQYGFGGLQDPSVPYSQLSVIWETMGLMNSTSSAVSVDSNTPPYGDSHALTTNAQPDTSTTDPGTPLHGLTVRDAFTPLTSSGTPVFDPVWGYLCFQ